MIESTDVKAPPTPAPTHMFIPAPTLATSTREPQDFSRLGMESDGKTNGDSASGMANPTTRDNFAKNSERSPKPARGRVYSK